MDASSSGTVEQHADGRGHALGRPRLRGVFHLYAFFVALALGSLLVSFAPGGRAQAAAAVFAAAVALMFGASALHHRIVWRERGYRWLGWVAVVVFPQLIDGVGWSGSSLVLAGGLLYTAGGVVYAMRRPNPLPAVFGYHEIFHVLVVAAVGLQYAVVAFWVVHPV